MASATVTMKVTPREIQVIDMALTMAENVLRDEKIVGRAIELGANYDLVDRQAGPALVLLVERVRLGIGVK